MLTHHDLQVVHDELCEKCGVNPRGAACGSRPVHLYQRAHGFARGAPALQKRALLLQDEGSVTT
ncbi:hypothetical protein CBM2629_A10102 [Cupriavidus taiwanensis]|nr:hypothetical protein CBM2629_A10102 [Cupriavidus taiwanensis]